MFFGQFKLKKEGMNRKIFKEQSNLHKNKAMKIFLFM